MTISQRTKTLVDRIPGNHAMSETLKTAVTEMLATSEKFTSTRDRLAADGTLTKAGVEKSQREALPEAIRSIACARAPLDKALGDAKARRTSLRATPPDKSDITGALMAQEIRVWLSDMSPAARAATVLKSSDVRILQAVSSAPRELSGFTGSISHVYDKTENRLAEIQHGPELRELNELETVLNEAQIAAKVARDDIQRAVAMDDSEFEKVLAPIEKNTNAIWLLRSKNNATGVEKILRVCPSPNATEYPEAQPWEIAAGTFYGNEAEWRAAQQAAT